MKRRLQRRPTTFSRVSARGAHAEEPLRNSLLIIALALLSGCEQTARSVGGQVTLDGQPLSEALIVFVPLEAGRKQTGASITQGEYEIQQINGLARGRYRVEIIDNPPLELAHRPPAELKAALRLRRVIPTGYSQLSPLLAEVGGDAPQKLRLDFQLVSDPQARQSSSQ